MKKTTLLLVLISISFLSCKNECDYIDFVLPGIWNVDTSTIEFDAFGNISDDTNLISPISDGVALQKMWDYIDSERFSISVLDSVSADSSKLIRDTIFVRNFNCNQMEWELKNETVVTATKS